MTPSKALVSRIFTHRFGPVALIALFLVGLSFAVRVVLLIENSIEADASILASTPRILGIGMFYDLVVASYVAAPFALYQWLVPERIYCARWHRLLFQAVFILAIFVLLFSAVAEWIFWEEFRTRFNFIAVDYLIYTQEVIGNIRQSYPVGWILGAIFVSSCAMFLVLQPSLLRSFAGGTPFTNRSFLAIVLLALPVLAFFSLDYRRIETGLNAFADELGENGQYQFFSALRNNDLDYVQNFASMPNEAAFRRSQALLAEPGVANPSGDPFILARAIAASTTEKRLNVVLVSVESLSADFMNAFGNSKGITPNLDRLTREGLFFTDLYASGTRTVRGLEALSLGLPPTPGQSIVKRTDNENLFTLGHVFREKGYAVRFLYGGYGYFDNMNHFFSANGYEVRDRASLAKEEITFENVWGVADEDLFALALRELDASHRAGKPAFLHVMTTSNHRPYTYPGGRIDIPSGSGRDGAVKYSDWAIGHFVAEAGKRPWFGDTLFVFTADHAASSGGKAKLPLNRFHIPAIFYAPNHIAPGRYERLAAQIDLPPTILGLLGFSYASMFYGRDLTSAAPGSERIFVGNFSEVGYYRDGQLVVLSPRKSVETLSVNFRDGTTQPIPADAAVVDEAIALYQSASWLFREKLNRLPIRLK